jgi:hypothetical protein
VIVPDQPKKHFFSVPKDLSEMTEEERDAWITQLHQRMVAALRSEEPESDEKESPASEG